MQENLVPLSNIKTDYSNSKIHYSIKEKHLSQITSENEIHISMCSNITCTERGTGNRYAEFEYQTKSSVSQQNR